MFQQIMTAGFVVGLFAMFFYTPVKYAMGVFRIAYGDLNRDEKFKCCIPIYNVISAESLYTGKISVIMLATAFCVIATVMRVIAIYMDSSNYALQTVTVIVFVVSLLFVYIANVYSVFIVLKDAGTGSLVSNLFKAILFPLGQYYIGTYLVTIIKNMRVGESTFK